MTFPPLRRHFRCRVFLSSLALAAALSSAAAAAVDWPEKTIPLLPGEKWWGGRIVDAGAMPYSAQHPFRGSVHSRFGDEGNQIQPLLLSSAGRYVWNEEPFDFEIAEGKLHLSDAAKPWQIGSGGDTLAGAFQAASRAFFPTSGRMPAPLLFSSPQYNTWIELTYDQRQDRILKYARSLIAQGYPPGVLMIDDNWQEAYGTWQFSARRFPDPKAMMNELHSLGFKVMVWVCPFVSADTEVYRALEKRGLLLKEQLPVGADGRPNPRPRTAIIRWWNGASGVLDLSNPATHAWFKGELDRLVHDFGVDGFKFDAGDTSFYMPDQAGARLISHAPRTPEQHTIDFSEVGLDYPFNEYRATWRMGGQPLAQRLRDKDHSWEALRQLIPGIVAQGLMGYAFTCPDLIGGGQFTAFDDPAKLDPELIVRSAQVHALMPMMQFSVAPWRVLSPELDGYCLAAAKLHLKFGERIVTLARSSAETGLPIVRPLAWQWPGKGYEEVRDQFMLGDDILVAPVLAKGGRARTVQFPPGKWRADDGTVVQGPAKQEVAAPLSRLPYFQLER